MLSVTLPAPSRPRYAPLPVNYAPSHRLQWEEVALHRGRFYTVGQDVHLERYGLGRILCSWHFDLPTPTLR